MSIGNPQNRLINLELLNMDRYILEVYLVVISFKILIRTLIQKQDVKKLQFDFVCANDVHSIQAPIQSTIIDCIGTSLR